MRTLRRFLIGVAAAAVFAAAMASTAFAGPAAPGSAGFDTAKPPYLVPVEPGVVVDPILSTGDIVGAYQMTGIPDGLGAYKTGQSTLELFMNHELDGPPAPPGVGARISRITLDRETRTVLKASYAFTGLEGFIRFCSSTLENIEGLGPWYFTGEEDTLAGALTPEETDGFGRNGSSIAMNAVTGEWKETAHFGHLIHENVVPVERLSKAFFLTTDDDFRNPPAFNAYVYAYIAKTWEGAIAGTEGSLYVWKATGAFDGDPSTNDVQKGETIDGRFVPVTQAENATSETLEAASVARGAFKFSRLEDAATAQQLPGRVYFVDTGKLGSETVRGRLYRLDIDPADPTHASLTLLLDGDRLDNLVNPDNIDTSAHSVVIQEDRNSEHRDAAPPWDGYGRVLVYDIRSGSVRYVARVNTPPALRPGTWESSGVINAQTFLGEDWWLMDVQAHSTPERQPGPTLAPNSSTGEDGQLLAIYIPDS
jgi:hypothetical protein